MRAPHGGILRFLVLEPCIRDELARWRPAAAARTDVLPLPINLQEAADNPLGLPGAPLRVGFVGLATPDKGIGLFLEVARRMRAAHGGRIAFHLVGRLMHGADLAGYDVLDEPPSDHHLPRGEFVRRLAALHYVMLPFRPGYYDLAASGALIDAITLLKPVIATHTGFVDALFAEAGDVGHLCNDDAALGQVLEAVLAMPDPSRYARQVAALQTARTQREPARLAVTYYEAIRLYFPFFIR